MLGQTLWLVGSGLVAGLVLSAALSRGLGSVLFGVSAADLPTYLVVAIALLVVGLGAALWPARRAANVDPSVALRAE